MKVLELLLGDAALGFNRRFRIVARIFARLRIAAEVGMALRTEPVEGAAHVQFLLRLHVEKGQVDGAATRMSALGHDILLVEEHALVEVRIEIMSTSTVFSVGMFFFRLFNGYLK